MNKVMKALTITLLILIILAALIAVPNIYLYAIGKDIRTGGAHGYEWSEDAPFEQQKTAKVEAGDGDFRILVLTDVHRKNHGTFAAELGINYLLDFVSKLAIDNLVKKTDPDLILVLGDTVLTQRNDIETQKFADQMDGYKIPWAPVFGNHDDEGRADKAALADIYSNSEYCLFDYGPEDLHGAGNYVEYLGLLADNGEYAKAMSLVESRRFHPWEGGEGKATRRYKRLKCALAADCERKGDYREAEKLYKNCLNFPHNLGEGKLILDYDNNVWYRLGEMYASEGDKARAEEAYKLALRGNTKVADNMYYNDTPVDYIYFAAKAKIKLGDKQGAEEIARAFADYEAENKDRHVKIDYFAVSLPDLLVWEQNQDERNNDFCDHVKELAEKIFEEVRQ